MHLSHQWLSELLSRPTAWHALQVQAQELALDVFPMSQLASAAPPSLASNTGPAPVSRFRTAALGVALWSQALLDACWRRDVTPHPAWQPHTHGLPGL